MKIKPQRKFGILLLSLLVYLLVSPFIPPASIISIAAHAGLSLVLFLAARAVAKQHHHRSFALMCLGPLLILYWLGIFDIIPFSTEVSLAFFVVYFGLLIYAFSLQLKNSEEVTRETIAGALCLYIILGLFWAAAYNLLYAVDANSFSGVLLEDGRKEQLRVFIYFSMVTLTTLGYGDITPESSGAAGLCHTEAIVGQFFTAVLVAWLVSMYRRPARKTKLE